MAQASVVYGSVLVMIGAVGYVLTDMVSLTALIPAAFGLVILVLGVVAYSPARRKMAMHIAMVVAVLGILGSASGLLAVARAFTGQAPGAAGIARALMAVTLIAYLVMGVRSFAAARRG